MNLLEMIHGEKRLNSVVDYLRSQAFDGGDSISNLKVQKLLYFCQGWALVLLEKPLFKADFKAWKHGPVIPETYHRFKKHGWGPMPPGDMLVENPEEYLSKRELK